MNAITGLISESSLSRRRKAAIVVQMLIAGGGSLPLAELPEDVQETLTGELAALRLLDRATMEAVASEFIALLDAIGMTAPGSRDGAIAALAGQLSPDLVQRWQAQMDQQRNGDHWPLVAAFDMPRLLRIMDRESIEICAVTLSKLPVAKAAEVLAKTPGPRARRITYAMSLTGDVAPDVVHRIGRALAQDYGQSAPVAFDKAPVQRLGAILNSATADTREDLLDGLGATDPGFASDLRRAIFTFKDIALRVQPTDIATAIRNVAPDQLATALAAALAGNAALVASADFIFENLSQRMAGQLREEAAERGKVAGPEAEAAMAAVTAAVRALADAGTISLRDPPED